MADQVFTRAAASMFAATDQEKPVKLADQNYYLDATRTRVVTEESPDQAFLLVGKACEISQEMVAHFGEFWKTPAPPPAQADSSSDEASAAAKAAKKSAKTPGDE